MSLFPGGFAPGLGADDLSGTAPISELADAGRIRLEVSDASPEQEARLRRLYESGLVKTSSAPTPFAPTPPTPEGSSMGEDFFSAFQDTLNRGVESVVAVYKAKSAAELARSQVDYQRAALENRSQYERQVLARQLTQPAPGISLPGTSSPAQAGASSVPNSTLIIGLLALGAVLFLVR